MRHAAVMCDDAGRIIHRDDAAEEMFGHARGDVLGASVELLVPEELRAPHRAGLARAMGGGERHLEGAATHLPVLHADGNVVRHPARFNHVSNPWGALVAAVAVFGPATPDEQPWAPIADD